MRAWILAIVMILLAGASHAQGDAGTRSVFATGAGNRALGLGGAYGAVADDASAVLWNPGGLGLVRRSGLQTTTTSYFGLGINEHFASFVLPNYRWGAASITLRYFGVSGIDQRDDRNVLIGEDLSDTQTELALGYGRRIGPAWSVGGSVKMLRHSVAGFKDSDIGLDLGIVLYPIHLMAPNAGGAERLSFGITLRNVIEPKLRLESERVADPGGVRFGLGYRPAFLARYRLLIAMDVEQSGEMDARLHAGAEIQLHPQLALRSGITDGVFAAGTSVAWRGVSIDYVLEDNKVDQLHRIGMSFAFGASVDEQRTNALAEQDREVQERLVQAFDRAQQDRINALLARATRMKDSRDFARAIEILAIVQALSPGNTEAAVLEAACWRERGHELEQHGDHAEAAVSYGRALSLEPNDADSQRGMARARSVSNEKAARSEAIRQRFDAGMDAFSRGDLAVARDAFAAILEVDAEDADASQMHRRTLRAIESRAAELATQCVRAIDAGQVDEARALIARIEALDATASNVSELTQRLENASARSISRTRALSVRPQTSTTTTGRHRQVTQADRQEAERLFQQGVRAMSGGRSAEGLSYFELAATLDPNHERAGEYLKREYLQRGIVAFSSGDLDHAVELWEKVLAIDPTDEKASGYLKRAREQMTRARQILDDK